MSMRRHLDSLRRTIADSQLYRSLFRHEYADTPRNQLLEVTSNVFLHLHPVTLPRHALTVAYTFCLGGLTFFLFLVETITGVLLMFYYRPVPDYAYMDMKTLEYAVQFGIVLRNLHRWGAHLMVICVMLHMLRVFLTGSYGRRASSTGWSACSCWCSRCCSVLPATCCRGTSWRSGR